MRMVLGYVLAFVGLAMIVLAVLDWLGIPIRRAGQASSGGKKASVWDVLLAFLQKAGWVATAGLILIYLGLKAIGVDSF